MSEASKALRRTIRLKHKYKSYNLPFKVALIDCDYLPYKIAFSVTTFESGVQRMKQLFEQTMDRTRCTHYIMFYTTKNNFRFNVVDDYKGQRVAETSPLYHQLRKHMLETYNCHQLAGFEADDYCSMAHLNLGTTLSILVSPDKDLLTNYPAVIYNPNTGRYINSDSPVGSLTMSTTEKMNSKNKIRKHRKLEGYGTKFLFAQMIMGDTADHIAGIKGKGKVAAYNALKGLKTVDDIHDVTLQMFKDEYGDEDGEKKFKTTFRLVWMVRYHPQFKLPPLVRY